MIRQLSKLYRSIVNQPQAMQRANAAAYARMTPIDRHLATQVATRTDGLFHPSYDLWRVKRINKLLEIYGADWFAGKTVVELGCGHADLGAFLAEIGANVLSVDGRAENVAFAKLRHRNVANLRIVQSDLEQPFAHLGRCDLLIHLGLLYHLGDVDAHLAQCWGLADDIVIESVVCDSLDPYRIAYFGGDRSVNEEALHGTQNRPSPFYVERLAEEAGFGVERLFTSDLNSGTFSYDWKHKNDGNLGGWRRRRMWRFRRVPQFASGGERAAAPCEPAKLAASVSAEVDRRRDCPMLVPSGA